MCEHKRMIRIQAKCSDMCSVNWPSGNDTDGYAPNIDGMCSGDYIDVKICIDCKMIPALASAEEILALDSSDENVCKQCCSKPCDACLRCLNCEYHRDFCPNSDDAIKIRGSHHKVR